MQADKIAIWTVEDGLGFKHSLTVNNPPDIVQLSAYDKRGRLHYFYDRSYVMKLWCQMHGFKCERKSVITVKDTPAEDAPA